MTASVHVSASTSPTVDGPPDERWLLPVAQAHDRLGRRGEPRHRGIGHTAHLSWRPPAPARESDRRRSPSGGWLPSIGYYALTLRPLRVLRAGLGRPSVAARKCPV